MKNATRWFLPFLMAVVSMMMTGTPAAACLNFMHEWTIVGSGPCDLADRGSFALADAFVQLRERLDGQAASQGLQLPRVMLAGIFFGGDSVPASPAQRRQVESSFAQAWPASRTVPLVGNPVPVDDFAALATIAARVPDAWSATVQVLACEADYLHLLDLIYFDLSILRTVYRERATVRVRVCDSRGNLVFMNQLSVTPTIVFDLMSRPSISLCSYFEKNDSRPRIMDLGELFKDVASQALELRPNEFRMPDLETSLPMASPRTPPGGHRHDDHGTGD